MVSTVFLFLSLYYFRSKSSLVCLVDLCVYVLASWICALAFFIVDEWILATKVLSPDLEFYFDILDFNFCVTDRQAGPRTDYEVSPRRRPVYAGVTEAKCIAWRHTYKGDNSPRMHPTICIVALQQYC